MIQWIKTLRQIVAGYAKDRARHEAQLQALRTRIDDLEAVLRHRTTLGVDVQHRGENHVIAMGRLNGVDYVQTFSVHAEDFHGLIEQLRHLRKYGTVRFVDAPPPMRAVFRSGFGLPV